MSSMPIDIDSELMSQLLPQMRPLETFSTFFRRITEELKTERALRQLFQRYVPMQVLEELASKYASVLFWDVPSELEEVVDQTNRSERESKGPSRARGIISTSTIMVCSLRDIMRLTANIGPMELAGLFQHFSSATADLVVEHMGFLCNAMPQTMVACWGGPGIANRHAFLACKCALQILNRASTMLENLPENQRFDIRMGISSGAVMLPPEGSLRTVDATLAGDAVDIASGLAEANKEFGTHILISQPTYYEISGSATAREIAEVALKGMNMPSTFYELVGMQT